MLRSAYTLFIAALAVSAQAIHFNDALRFGKRQTANSTSNVSIPPSTTTAVTTSRSTSGGVIITSSTSIVSPSSSLIVSISTATSTITPTNSAGSATGSPTVVTSASSASYSVSYSSYVTSIESQVTSTFTFTSNGQAVTATRTSNTVVPVTTSAQVTGSLISGSNGGGSGGLSDNSKKIIGGVVGGVGGALLLGALAFTAWRIWGRKKNYHDDDLYDPNSQQEKLSSSTDNPNANTPFQSTLDQYHRPGPVNTAANF